MMQYYATIYASSMGVMLVFKFIRGIAFVKVRTSHRVLTTSGTKKTECSRNAVKFRGSFSRYTLSLVKEERRSRAVVFISLQGSVD